MRRHRKRGGPPVVLVYHRVGSCALDPLLLTVSPERFDAQMRVVREHFEPIDAETFAALAVEDRLPPRAVCVTFDDGYLDNLTNAAPILERRGVPGCVFVATGLVEGGVESWWDAIEPIVAGVRRAHGELRLVDEGGEIVIGGLDDDPDALEGWNVEMPDRTPRHALYRRLLSWLHDRPVARIAEHLGRLRAWVGADASPRTERRFMTIEQVGKAARAPGITIGGHTHHHPVLATLPFHAQVAEIAAGRRALETWTGRAPSVFAYPFGTVDQYRPESRGAVAAAGFEFGFANMNAAPSGAHRFEIPRMIVRDWDDATFVRKLEGRS
ncbi:hypothetical protein ASA1KI_36190 [Opitutales bacterium ASA1]|nr:hypothetical protein ASA1KI_36190 [Opitutales bacterium ASA1]